MNREYGKALLPKSSKIGKSFVAMGNISPGVVIAKAVVAAMMQPVTEHRVRAFLTASSARINRARTNLIKDFLSLPPDVEWLFLWDSDTILPREAVKEMLEYAEENKRRLISGLSYIWQSDIQRILPSMVIITGDEPEGEYGTIYHTPPADEPRYVEVDATGAFCLLVHRSLLVELQEASDWTYPWFNEVDLGGGKVRGPDFEFFERVRDLTGENPVIDTHQRCGHVKDWVLTHEQAVQAFEVRGGPGGS